MGSKRLKYKSERLFGYDMWARRPWVFIDRYGMFASIYVSL
jgi:hypothetical protein